MVQLYNLRDDLGETKNRMAEHPDKVTDLVTLLAKAIRKGRSNPGPPQSNDGWPDTFLPQVLEAYPALMEP